MIETLKDELSKKEVSAFHQSLLDECKRKIGLSRKKMQEFYWRWDKNEAVYKGELELSKEDLKAMRRKEPVRIIDPLTHAQVNTFVAIIYALFTQRPRIFELEGTGPEDHNPAKIIEALLEKDLDYNNFKGSCLQQFIRSVAKRGIGVLKYYWDEDATYEEQEIEEELNLMGRVLEGFGVPQIRKTKTEWTRFCQFKGNKIYNQDPYRFFPDPRVPLDRFQEGEFCGDEEEFSWISLKRGEFEGRYAGVDHIEDIHDESKTDPFGGRRISFRDNLNFSDGSEAEQDFPTLPVIVTRLQLDVIPAQYKLSNGEMMGEETYPCRYLIEYANDQRIINVEKLPYPRFTYEVGQFLPDESEYVGQSLSDTLEGLQDTVSWLLNVRIANIRKVVQTRLLVDPVALDIDDLEQRRPVIKMTPAATGKDIRQFIHQLQLQDVTTNNVQDVSILRSIAKEATGVSENLLGQFASGRRSAQEAANVNQNALARLKIHADAIWDTALKPLAQGLVYNHRKFLDEPTLLNVRGLHNFDAQTGQLTPAAQTLLNVTPEMLEGSYDLTIYEGSTPSERNFQATQVFELLKIAIQNPQAFFQIFQKNPVELSREWLYLIGMENLAAFDLTTPQLQQFLTPYLAEKAIEYHVQTRPNPPAFNQSNLSTGSQGGSEGEGIDNLFSALAGTVQGGDSGLLAGSGEPY
jgi:hypothetical protein